MSDELEDYVKLTDEEIGLRVGELAEWKLVDRSLVKEFQFENMFESSEFFSKVAQAAEPLQHHPDIEIEHGTNLKVKLTTKDVGGISQYDFMLARKIDNIG